LFSFGGSTEILVLFWRVNWDYCFVLEGYLQSLFGFGCFFVLKG